MRRAILRAGALALRVAAARAVLVPSTVAARGRKAVRGIVAVAVGRSGSVARARRVSSRRFARRMFVRAIPVDPRGGCAPGAIRSITLDRPARIHSPDNQPEDSRASSVG